jgi:hypothetical protein
MHGPGLLQLGSIMEKKTQQKDAIVPLLENIVSRMLVQSSDVSDLDYRVYPNDAAGRAYVIEISKGRFSQTVLVDRMAVRRLELGQLDSNLSREIRVAMLTVSRLSEDRD